MASSEHITACLMAGHKYAKNPYMSLLRDALTDSGVDVRTTDLPLFFPLTRTFLRSPDVDVLQVDWIHHYFEVSPTGVRPVDAIFTLLRVLTFLLDLVLVSALPVALVRTVHNRRHHGDKYRRTERVVAEVVFAVADAITVKCQAARHVVAATYVVPDADRIHVVPDGSYVAAYENEVSVSTARRDLSIDVDAFVFLFFGHVRRYKGLPELVETFHGLGLSGAELWIVGTPADTDLQRDLETLAADVPGVRTHLQFVPDDRVQYYMNAADVMVLPYRRILNSGSARLGISFGLPVVAPSMGCLPETLATANDFLYDPDDPDGLATELRGAYDHPTLQAIGTANYECALEQTWTATAEALSDVYRRALETPTAGPVGEPSAGTERP